MAENGVGKVFLPGHGRCEYAAKGFAALHKAGLPNGLLLQQTVEQYVYGTVLPGLFLGMLQQIRTGQGLSGFPEDL